MLVISISLFSINLFIFEKKQTNKNPPKKDKKSFMVFGKNYGIYGEKGEKKGEKRKKSLARLYGTAKVKTVKRTKQRTQCEVLGKTLQSRSCAVSYQ